MKAIRALAIIANALKDTEDVTVFIEPETLKRIAEGKEPDGEMSILLAPVDYYQKSGEKMTLSQCIQ